MTAPVESSAAPGLATGSATGLGPGPAIGSAPVTVLAAPGSPAVVLIGRNEGARLVAALASLGPLATRTVYVDSGSTDASVAAARAAGALVVALDLGRPFTAARARNAGAARALAEWPDLNLLQFMDGDCCLDSGWISAATAFLEAHPRVAVVAGRRRERHPERSVYNWLCDREWDAPSGDATECGGDALMRVSAFAAVGGYSADLIAGEEPELCVRLRAAGWRIHRLADEMTLHDAAMTRLSQWWKRSARAGHAFAEVAARHRGSPFGIWRANVRRIVLWGAILPAAVVAGAVLAHPAFLLLLLVYPAQVARLAVRGGAGRRQSWITAFFLVLARFPEMSGLLRFYRNRLLGRGSTLLEYK